MDLIEPLVWMLLPKDPSQGPPVHFNVRRRRISVRTGCEYEIPATVDMMKFRSPKISGVVHVLWGLKEKLGFCIIPDDRPRASTTYVRNWLRSNVMLSLVVYVIIISIIMNYPSKNWWVNALSWGRYTYGSAPAALRMGFLYVPASVPLVRLLVD